MQWLANLILNWLWGKASAFFIGLFNKIRRQKAVDQSSKDSVQPLKDAKTPEEIDAAADDALRKL